MRIDVLLTVIWLSSTGHITDQVEMYTNTMEYCKQLARQIEAGDGAVFAGCKWVRNHSNG